MTGSVIAAGLRALSARVVADEISEDLRNAILLSTGWRQRQGRHWTPPHLEYGWTLTPASPLTSIDDAFKVMPEGWFVFRIEEDRNTWRVEVRFGNRRAVRRAPDLPRAWTAAALEARAIDAEEAHGV